MQPFTYTINTKTSKTSKKDKKIKQRIILPVHFCSFTVKFWNGYFWSSCRICNGNLAKKNLIFCMILVLIKMQLSQSPQARYQGVTVVEMKGELARTFYLLCFSWTKVVWLNFLFFSFFPNLVYTKPLRLCHTLHHLFSILLYGFLSKKVTACSLCKTW